MDLRDRGLVLVLLLFAVAVSSQARAAWQDVRGSCMNDSTRNIAVDGIQAVAFQWAPACGPNATAMWVAITADQCLELGSPGQTPNSEYLLYLDVANAWTGGKFNIYHPLVQSAARACGVSIHID